MRRLYITMVAMVCCMQMMAGDIFVSPSGNDGNPGTREKPLATLEQALRQAREWRRLQRKEVEGGIRINLESGTYLLSRPIFIRPEDSGTELSPTIIRGAAVLRGGIRIEKWQRGCNDERVAPALRDKIWTAEAPMAGNKILWFRQMDQGRMATQFGTFYVDGGNAAMQTPSVKMERMLNFNTNERTITIPTPRQDLSRANQLEMLVHQRWATAILRVKSMRVMGDSTIVSFHEPESKIEFEHPWPQPVINGEKGSSSYCLQNALELLDEPGEWYQDYPSGRVYYYPYDAEILQLQDSFSAWPYAPALKTLVNISGTPERRVHHIRFEGVNFMDAAWTRPSEQGHVTLQGGFAMIDAYKLLEPGLPEKAELENQAWIERPDAAVKVSYADDIVFDDCFFHHLAATGLDMEKSVTRSVVQNCSFQEIGGTAIMVGTFPDQGFETHVPYSPKHDEDICDMVTISNNEIRHCTTEDWGAVGIAAGYVRNILIQNNEVSDLNYSGICVGWGWTALESGMRNNRIEGNHVYYYAKQLYDAGGIYTLSYQPNSFIRYNTIEAPVKAPYATNDRAFCIYFDEATDGYTVENNWMPFESFGYNKPGPHMIIRNNGPQVKVGESED
ncbi:MAG: right-handed parallel beta-helix repeat-containing protein [Prevotella sp.]|nr:right-handed parallel beta-helix repeat-containing protein [Prevotella sp.]